MSGLNVIAICLACLAVSESIRQFRKELLALKALADHLRENDDLIAAALSANTPVAPAPKQSTAAVVDEA